MLFRSQREFPFVFVSDRCKGLKQALSTVFPNNCETSCAYHIRSNVEQKFGNVAASDVMAMALTYSKRNYNYLLEKMRRTKHQAAEYIERINESGVVWSNSQSTDNIQQLPPRFGQVTSNTAESVNSMFDSARDLVWLDAVERMIEIMLTRICSCREKYKDEDDSKLVRTAQQELQKRWDGTASMSVLEVEEGSGAFHVTASDIVSLAESPRPTAHIVKPDMKLCSCGVWQDTLLDRKSVV